MYRNLKAHELKPKGRMGLGDLWALRNKVVQQQQGPGDGQRLRGQAAALVQLKQKVLAQQQRLRPEKLGAGGRERLGAAGPGQIGGQVQGVGQEGEGEELSPGL